VIATIAARSDTVRLQALTPAPAPRSCAPGNVIARASAEMGNAFAAPSRKPLPRELLVRQVQRTLPLTVYRPSFLVGDTQKGEIDRSTVPVTSPSSSLWPSPLFPCRFPDAMRPSTRPVGLRRRGDVDPRRGRARHRGTFHWLSNPLGCAASTSSSGTHSRGSSPADPVRRGCHVARAASRALLRPQRADSSSLPPDFLRTTKRSSESHKRVRFPTLEYLDAAYFARNSESKAKSGGRHARMRVSPGYAVPPVGYAARRLLRVSSTGKYSNIR